MDTRFTIGVIVRAACSLSVDGNNVGITHRESVANPTAKALAKFVGIEQRENSSERVVRRYAVGQSQKSLEPLLFCPAEASDLNPIVGPANDGAKSDDN